MSIFVTGKEGCLPLLLAALVIMPTAEAGDDRVSWAQSDEERATITAKLVEKARSEGPQRVVVGLNTTFMPEGRLSQAVIAKQRLGIRSAQSDVLAQLTGFNAAERRRFKYVPFMVFEADSRAIEHLAGLPMVASLEEDRAERPIMESSNEVIGSPDAWSAGYDGSGWAVAVLDTGDTPILRNTIQSGFRSMLLNYVAVKPIHHALSRWQAILRRSGFGRQLSGKC